MSAVAARVVQRIVVAAAAGGMLALVGSIGLGAAHAEPTPDPTPASSVAPTPNPTADATSASAAPSLEPVTPTPTRSTASPVPTPTESSDSPTPAPMAEEASPTSTPTVGDVSPSPAPSAGGVTPTPIPTGLATPWPSAAESQGVAALAVPVADERLYVVVRSQCAGDGGETLVDVSLYLLTDEDLTLDYVLTDDEGVTRTGTVTLRPEDSQASEDPHGTLEFTGLPVGSFHIGFYADGGVEPVTVQNFQILNCLETVVSCGQITFANPATNPTVSLTIGNGPYEDEDYRDFDLEPGEGRLFRTDRGVINWLAGTVEGQAGENFSIAYTGSDDEVRIPTDCGSEPPAAGPDVGLADTGGSAYAPGMLTAGGSLAAAGVILLLRRRRLT